MLNFRFLANKKLKGIDVKKTFKGSKKISLDGGALFIKPNNLDYPRLGFIITKKNIRNATNRNKIKRVVRESFRLNQHILNGNDIIFVAYKGLAGITKDELKKCLVDFWKKQTKYRKN